MTKKMLWMPVLAAVLGVFAIAQAATVPVAGKIIALDAGHGNGDTGAVNIKTGVIEADVNADVVQALQTKLAAQGAYVVVAGRLSTRKARVDDAAAKCAALDINTDGIADGRKCDILVSVHHNGSSDPAHDGTLTIYTQNSDKPLATSLLNTLKSLTGKSEGLLNGGYGMTVYKNLVSSLTEAYYITNDCEAELYQYSKGVVTDIDQSCKDAGYQLEDRINHEADLQMQGISNYFATKTTKGGR